MQRYAWLRTFHEDYPESSRLHLYRGDEVLERNGVQRLPVDRFLRELLPGRDLRAEAGALRSPVNPAAEIAVLLVADGYTVDPW